MAPPISKRPPKKPTPRKASSALSRKDTKPNASILTFFKKVEIEKTLFCESSNGAAYSGEVDDEPAEIHDESDPEQVTELASPTKPFKRRKLSPGPLDEIENISRSNSVGSGDQKVTSGASLPRKTVGGFVVDSDSEDDEGSDTSLVKALPNKSPDSGVSLAPENEPGEKRSDCELDGDISAFQEDIEEEEKEMEEMADVSDDFVGEEYREMLFSQEQARLDADETEEQFDDFPPPIPPDDSVVESCPICGGSLAGADPDETTRHVNSCLDGNPTPLPASSKSKPPEVAAPSPFALKAAIPRPGQRDPLSNNGDAARSSAFSRLMSGNAESSAWSAAAASETAARGKPAYKRTCPFYKIMPGFSICVDAFRYGAVKDCKAYFLSHFHSDHYIGLSGNWRHGPIYCSRVTGGLVKQQLKVDPKWVVELEFDSRFDIPGTDGAWVTMIPANHCPGSSMFLFEKRMGQGPNPRLQRILHCGDFRACPEHVAHEGLKPDVLDKASGKLKHQKIDICYLDTTYLSPRYSFPPQMDVITACADLCASLNSDSDTAESTWDTLEKGTSNTSVSRFFAKENGGTASESGPRQGSLLVVCGTYSIGKERICVAIAKALNTKIFASPAKIRIFKLLDDPELASLLTSDPLEAQVHMQSLMEIRAETLQDYLDGFKPRFSRIVGFRPSGWNYRPTGASKLISANTQPSSAPTTQILHGKAWSTRFRVGDLQKQRGSTKEAMCFGVPYSEHSSFRELAMFLMALRIERVVPTVNVASEASRAKMKAWIDRWLSDRARGGVLRIRVAGADGDGEPVEEWDGKGKRDVYW
ncbi:related to PSO2 - DNA repair protein [Cephalotrichum gorgonifer]|uniref:Related to PSO2 - DNA repair protein n=1 Tax=Cephalotrichum gorgonifer TaxID=2041049 RepID=A0AAE8MNQ5_9PEZI|nr:related to PSO2 - DNA repair protein [Cephalotrichum gorgonifer]